MLLGLRKWVPIRNAEVLKCYDQGNGGSAFYLYIRIHRECWEDIYVCYMWSQQRQHSRCRIMRSFDIFFPVMLRHKLPSFHDCTSLFHIRGQYWSTFFMVKMGSHFIFSDFFPHFEGMIHFLAVLNWYCSCGIFISGNEFSSLFFRCC